MWKEKTTTIKPKWLKLNCIGTKLLKWIKQGDIDVFRKVEGVFVLFMLEQNKFETMPLEFQW